MSVKQLAADMARFWLQDNAIIIDTETTGLSTTDEIVEISALDCEGNVLLDTLVRPLGDISYEAQRVHGITLQDTAGAPSFDQILPDLAGIIHNRTVVMFNANFDTRLIDQSARLHGKYTPRMNAHCAMHNYARFHGQWDDNRNQWKWQSLENAAWQMNIQVSGNAHRALTDCRTTLALIQAMADYQPNAA